MGNRIHFIYSQGYNVTTSRMFLYTLCLVAELTVSAQKIRGLGRYLETKAFTLKMEGYGGNTISRVIFLVIWNNCIITYQNKVYYICGSVYCHLQLLLWPPTFYFLHKSPILTFMSAFFVTQNFNQGCLCDHEFIITYCNMFSSS